MNIDKVFNCEDLQGFISTIVEILPFRGYSMSNFYLCEFNKIRFVAKLCFYKKTSVELYGKPADNTLPHTDAEIRILELFRRNIIERNITPCLLEIVYSHQCNLTEVIPRQKFCDNLANQNMTKYAEDVFYTICRYNDLVKHDLAHPRMAFVIMERCDMTLDNFIKKIDTNVSIYVFKSLLFQIVYTMYAIKKLYPKFHHYDLHTDNIMLKFDPKYKYKIDDPKYLVFWVDDVRYSVPYFGIFVKIIDFGFSSVPEEEIISNATEDRLQMFSRSDNDLLFLFHWIHIGAGQGNFAEDIDRILTSLEPNRSWVQYHTEYIRKIEKQIPNYTVMVKNRVFSEYRFSKIRPGQIYAEYEKLH